MKEGLIQDTFEFVDIFSQVFQFMEIRDIYPLQRVSGFFYRMIETLKESYIRPVYEIGVVATSEEQLESFIRNYLNSSHAPKKNPSLGDLISSDNFTDEIPSIPNVLTIYEKYERQFIFKQDRFRAVFFPIVCGKYGSLGRDELNRLEGFIFLSPEYSSGFAFMPEGVDICATILDDHFFSSKHFTKEHEKDLKDRGLGFVKNSSPKSNTQQDFVKLQKIKMPVWEFGTVAIEQKVYKYQEESLVQCIMYIVSHSNRCLALDHSLSNKKQGGTEEKKGSQKLFEKITSILKLKNEELITNLKSLFRNRYDYYNLLATDNLVYMTKRLCFFHLPLDIQLQLLRKLYDTLAKYTSSLSPNDGKVKLTLESEYICVQYKQIIHNDDVTFTYGYEKPKQNDIRQVQIRFFFGERIEFHYKNLGKHNEQEQGKCSLQ